MTLETWICSFFVYILDNETDHNLPSRGKKKKRKTVTVKPSSNRLFANKP